MPRTTQEQQATVFRALHARGCFVVANPWNRGSARLFESLGFQALATTSAGLAFDAGREDSVAIGFDATLSNARDIIEATPLPVTVDLQSGYASSLEGLANNVTRCVAAGASGLSIEDATGDPAHPLYPLDEAVERVRVARDAIRKSGHDALLTGRAECFLVGEPNPLPAAIERLVAYADAGADCLYAPGLRSVDEVQAVVDAVAPKPVNVLVGGQGWMTLSALEDIGVRRISVGSALARVAWGAVVRVATQVANEGVFEGLREAEPYNRLNTLFADPPDSGSDPSG
ncbi:MAG: isocitrate lyase/phosphoenolpyruvate mutase family protein [Myxococcota bacterium]